MFYLELTSASEKHIKWLRGELFRKLGVVGHIARGSKKVVYQLKYAKKESLKILKKMFYNQQVVALSRKCLKISRILEIIGEHL